jgi:hypothetical protein
MDEEVAARTGMNESRQRIIVDDVKFDGPIHVSDAVRQQVVSDLKQHDFVRGVHAMIPKSLFATGLRKQITVV